METIIKKLEKLTPDRNVIFTAIETLKTEREIGGFYKELKDKYPGYTDQNIGYILGYYGSETQKLWFNLLPKVNHPIFGRRLNEEISPKEAFEAGENWAKGEQKEV